MSPVAAAVAVYVLAVIAGIVIYVRVRDSLVDLYERLRWRLAERRARTFGLAVVAAAAGLTAVLATHDIASNRRNAPEVGVSGSQLALGPLGTWLPRPAPAHVHPHRQTRGARTTAPSHRPQRRVVVQTSLVSDIRTTSTPVVRATATQGTGPSPLQAPPGASPPSPLKAP